MESLKKIKLPSLASFDIYNQIKQLQSDIAYLKKWKTDTADPKMENNRIGAGTAIQKGNNAISQASNAVSKAINASNIASGASNKASTAISNAGDAFNKAKGAEVVSLDAKKISIDAINITKIVEVKVKEALDKVLQNKDVIGAIISDIKNQLKPTINNALAQIDDAKAYATGALDSAKNIVSTIEGAADGLKSDGENVSNMATIMIETLGREINDIKNAFQVFGTSLYNGASVIVKETKNVALELKEAATEIKPALNASASQIKIAQQRADAWNPIGAALAIIRAIEHLLWRGAGGQGSVLSEMIEGFNEINAAFGKLSTGFTAFGGILKSAPAQLGAEIGNSVNDITAGVTNFGNSFGQLTDGLSARFKGAKPPAPAILVKAVYQKTPAELESERKLAQQKAKKKADAKRAAKKKADAKKAADKRAKDAAAARARARAPTPRRRRLPGSPSQRRRIGR